MRLAILAAVVAVFVGVAQAAKPAAMPSQAQLDWLQRGVGVMITYNMQTYNDHMSVGKVVSPDTFAPTNSTNPALAWVAAAKSFGAKYAVLTTDHFSGFNLWPSSAWQTDPYTTASSHWRLADGSADLVSAYKEAMREQGIAPGVYYSVHNNWAMNVSNFKTAEPAKQAAYNAFALAQLRELLANRSWSEVWFDAGVHNDINPAIGPLVRELAPDAICHSCNGFVGDVGVRWVGNEHAQTPLPNWYAVASPDACAGQPNAGTPNGSVFCPPSCDTVLGVPSQHHWFWWPHGKDDIKSTDALVAQYLSSVGRGCNLILNIAPDPSGGVDAIDAARYAQMGQAIAGLTATQLAAIDNVTLEGTTDAQTGSCNLSATLTLPSPTELSNVTVQVYEALATQGQRIAGHQVWLQVQSGSGTEWVQLAASSTVGFQRVYVPGAADAWTEGTAKTGTQPSWPLVLTAVQVRVTALPEGMDPPQQLARIAVFAHADEE